MEKGLGEQYHLVISEKAITDIENIYLHSLQHHGEPTANNYLDTLDNKLKSLITNPKAGQDFSWIKVGTRRLIFNQHVIYYSINHLTIRILRVLHQRQDPANKL